MTALAFTVQPQDSTVIWTGKKVTGTHSGTIKVTSGSVKVKDGIVEGGYIKFDTTSITVSDITDPETNSQLKGHLLADDFFGADHFPIASFNIVSVTHKNGNDYDIIGKLTIKDITHDISFLATISLVDGLLTTKGIVTVDRTLYGMKFRSGNFFQNLGDTLISNDFILDITLLATEV